MVSTPIDAKAVVVTALVVWVSVAIGACVSAPASRPTPCSGSIPLTPLPSTPRTGDLYV